MFPNLQQVASLLVAQAPQGPGGCDDGSALFLPMAMMLILYFIWLRPAQRDRKQHQSMLDTLKRGDEVVTASGIIGSVADISERIITLEVARNVKIRVLRSSVSKKLESAEEKADDKPKSEKAPTSKSKS